jgi:NAD(P)-dependent dehydrogenase (short-subunit alcohol dehydrogenase family)
VQRFAATHQVLIADLRAPAEPLPAGVRWVATDITDAAACRALLPTCRGRWPRAGAFGRHHGAGAAHRADRPDEWRRVLDVNLTGAFLVAQAAIPALRAARGAMVMIASRAGRTGYAALAPRRPAPRRTTRRPRPG